MGVTTVDQIIATWFNSGFGTNDSGLATLGNLLFIALCFLATILLAGIIGFEREYHGHSAGLRTHILIALGSSVVMVLSMYGFAIWDANGGSRDPARLAAQVVTGIGFLGAGAIIQNGVSVKGLTTATTIWVSMAIGLACGSGNFLIAAFATAIIMIVLVSLRRIEKFASKRYPIVTLVVPSDHPIMKDLLTIANRYSLYLNEINSEIVTFQETSALRISFRCSYTSNNVTDAFVTEVRDTIAPLSISVSTEN